MTKVVNKARPHRITISWLKPGEGLMLKNGDVCILMDDNERGAWGGAPRVCKVLRFKPFAVFTVNADEYVEPVDLTVIAEPKQKAPEDPENH